ncbi:hypothetical protein HO133_005170 [Letharia lupina]|uniref:Ran guanine nucleotide release factor n=1 Tax=Letharia lupina TaxID=560253 RepID=A0A8H6C974_9LECA|nr:uncharacterized protein HO133_005170 [Letharia lupina]KAF6219345.1 hypothetical protein HO133_005170 [Letharia lupina]
MTTAFEHTELFGGAITANIPSNFADVSNIRQVPDNQEAYLDKNGFISLTFDITERVSHLSTDKEALEYHFADIVAEKDTKSMRSIVENAELPNFPPPTPVLALTAITKPPASTVAANSLTPTHTDIYFTLIRLVEQSTDIVITLNTPHLASEAEGQIPNETETGTLYGETEQEVGNMYHQIVTSFAIKDWGLFSGE